MKRVVFATLAGLVAFTFCSAEATSIPEHDPHTLIVKLADHIDGKAMARVKSGGALAKIAPFTSMQACGVASMRPLFPIPPKGVKNEVLYDSLEMGQFFVVDLAPSISASAAVGPLEALPDVALAEYNFIHHLVGEDVVPNDPLFFSQWHYGMIDLPRAWGISQGSSSVIVGVIDTGIDYFHPDLDYRVAVNLSEYYGYVGLDDDGNGYTDDVYGYDFINWDGYAWDDQSHGTHVSGTIGAESNNQVGVSGVDWNCLLLASKVLNENGSGSTDDIILGIYYAVNNGCWVLNISIGGVGSTSYGTVLNYAYGAHVAVIAAMGNSDSASLYYPAVWPTTLAVGATDSNDDRWVDNDSSGSDYGNHIDVVAPGVAIISTFPYWHNPAYYGSNTGTSMATPHVTGLAALILAARPGLSIDSLYWYIWAGAQDQVGDPAEDTPGWDQFYGFGRINAFLRRRIWRY